MQQNTMTEHIYVIKRNGSRVPVSFDQILQRIRSLSDGLDHVNPDLVAQKVCNQLQDGISTTKLDEFAAETCAMMQARYHPNYGKLAARIVINNHQKNTPATLLDCIEALYHGRTQGISDEYHDLVTNHRNIYQPMIDYSRDFGFDYFGFKTLEKGYLLRKDGVIVGHYLKCTAPTWRLQRDCGAVCVRRVTGGLASSESAPPCTAVGGAGGGGCQAAVAPHRRSPRHSPTLHLMNRQEQRIASDEAAAAETE
jgi:hypothetical protein